MRGTEFAELEAFVAVAQERNFGAPQRASAVAVSAESYAAQPGGAHRRALAEPNDAQRRPPRPARRCSNALRRRSPTYAAPSMPPAARRSIPRAPFGSTCQDRGVSAGTAPGALRRRTSGDPGRVENRRRLQRHRGRRVRRRHTPWREPARRHGGRADHARPAPGDRGRARILRHAQPPRTPRELAAHACINYRFTHNGALYRWPFACRGQAIDVVVQVQ